MSGWIESEGASPRSLICGLNRLRAASRCENYWHLTEPGKNTIISIAPDANIQYCHTGLESRLRPLRRPARSCPGHREHLARHLGQIDARRMDALVAEEPQKHQLVEVKAQVPHVK